MAMKCAFQQVLVMQMSVKLLWTCQICGMPSQKVGDEGAIKQESYPFKLTSSRKTCGDFVQAALAKVLADHATCLSFSDADDVDLLGMVFGEQ